MKKTKKWKIVLLCIFCVTLYTLPIIGITIFSYMEEKGKTFEIKADVIEISKGKMIIERQDAFYKEEDNAYYITGYLKNTTNKIYTSISLTYRVYDKDKNVLGEATAYLETLGKQKTWKFKAVYQDIDVEEVDSYEFVGIDYY